MALTKILPLLICLTASASAAAESAFQSLQFEQHKQQVMTELKKVCHQPKGMTDTAWANSILSSEDNQRHVREATVAIERNNTQNYWDAIGKVECPEM
ncbi:hypothetical protein MUA02_20960 [Enterobacteriaceae bacterium H20N1]|uniref:Uncharacterized protein YicS n=1 Tax=Dryocola boscaweniae TaxID=2925397 RepID=A0A9X2W5I8_9ENTR|nr:YicS family protein [Dryocola boscaweniae]MCT4700393.1 hypothetical protein [Dryocola boscaweniae]MCT4721490.1 hypothetical protein [Dryocola boscaweniae]